MLKAFVDDSGSGDNKYFVMAGYVGPVTAWDSFDAPWRSVLADDPKIPYFHAVEAQSLRSDGVWAGISETERDSKIDRLIKVIHTSDIQAVYVRLKQADYDEIFRGKVPDKWDSPYYCLFSSFVSLCGLILPGQFAADGPIEFAFDNHQKYRKHGQEFYDGTRLLIQEQTAPNIHFRNDEDFPPLQAADLLAWQVRRAFCYPKEERRHYYECKNGGAGGHVAWSISPELLWSWRNQFEEFSRDLISRIAESCGVELIGDIRPWTALDPDLRDIQGHKNWKDLKKIARNLQRGLGR